MIHACLRFVVSPAHQEKGWWPRDSGTAKSAVRDTPARRRPIGVRNRLQRPDATMHACKAPETAKEIPLAETTRIRNINTLIVGGGSSHQRTRLRTFVPCFTGKYREIRQLWARDSQGALAFGGKFNRLPTEFPSRQSRENLRAIREPEAGNSEPYPNNGSRVWRHTESFNAFILAPGFGVGFVRRQWDCLL
jgi:hypothetical protein